MSSVIHTHTYRHPKKEGMFLFVRDGMDWEELPAPLQEAFSAKSSVISFDMTPEKKLARADHTSVWQALSTQGYYVQMPPADPNALQQAEDLWIAQQQASQQA